MKPQPARFVSKTTLALLALAGATALLCLQPIVEAQSASSDKTGTIEKIKVHGASLEGNLESDPADRDAFVYLPPSYASQAGRRYPVVYFLHGYGATAEAYWKLMVVPDASNKVMNAGTVHEMIVELPDVHTIYDGSMFPTRPRQATGKAILHAIWSRISTATTGPSPTARAAALRDIPWAAMARSVWQ